MDCISHGNLVGYDNFVAMWFFSNCPSVDTELIDVMIRFLGFYLQYVRKNR